MKFKLNDRVSWSIFNLTGTVTNVLSDIVYIKWDKCETTISYNAFECRNMEVMSLELFKVGDRVVSNYSSYNGVITRIDKYVKYPCFTTYFKWDDGDEILPTEKCQFMHNEFTIKWDNINHLLSYTDTLYFHLDTTPVLATKEADTTPVFKVGDSVLSRDYKYSGVVTNVGFSNCISIKWDHHDSELFYSNTSDINALIPVSATKEADTTPVFKVGDRVVNNYSKNKGVIIRIDKYVEHHYPSDESYFKWFKWDGGKDMLPTKKPKHSGIEITIKWDDIDEPYLYTDTLNFHLDTSPILATKEADTTSVFKVGDRIAHKKSSNKGVIISNYRTILLAVQWDGSSEYFYISPKDLTLDNSIVATNDKLKVTLEVDITLNVKDELLNVVEQMLSILVKQKDYDSAKQLLECIKLLNNLTNTK
jgi:hypothetical protein